MSADPGTLTVSTIAMTSSRIGARDRLKTSRATARCVGTRLVRCPVYAEAMLVEHDPLRDTSLTRNVCQ